MKRLSLALLVIILASMLVGCGPVDSPEKAAKEWLEAWATLDGNKLAERTCDAQQEAVQSGAIWLSAFAALGQMFTGQRTQADISDLRFVTISKSGDTAQVRVTGEIRTAVLAIAQTQEVDETWLIVREDGKWKWCGSLTETVQQPLMPATLEPATATPTPLMPPTSTPTPIGEAVSPTPTPSNLWVMSGLSGENVASLAAGSGVIYAATYGKYHGVFRSEDGGQNWFAINNGLGGLDVYSIAVAPANPDVVYVVTDQGVWQSLDGGATWRPSWTTGYGEDGDELTQVVVGAVDGSIAYVSNDTWCRFFETVDTGASWSEVTYVDYASLHGLFYNIAEGTAYLYGSSGVYKSIDYGRTWWRAAAVGDSYKVTTLCANENEPDTVYVGTLGHGLYKSEDGGGSWVPMNTALPNQGHGLTATSCLVDPLDPQTIYITWEELGAYQSTDGGETWAEVNFGLYEEARKHIATLAISDKEPRFLFAGTEGQGVWRYNLPPSLTSLATQRPRFTPTPTEEPTPTPVPPSVVESTPVVLPIETAWAQFMATVTADAEHFRGKPSAASTATVEAQKASQFIEVKLLGSKLEPEGVRVDYVASNKDNKSHTFFPQYPITVVYDCKYADRGWPTFNFLVSPIALEAGKEEKGSFFIPEYELHTEDYPPKCKVLAVELHFQPSVSLIH